MVDNYNTELILNNIKSKFVSTNNVEVLSENFPKVPDDIEIISFLGQGNRANVYKAKLDTLDVVVKAYKPDVIEKYRHKYKVDIAEYEYGRNCALREISEIERFIAKPYRVYAAESGYAHSIVQQFVEGTILENLIEQLGHLPQELLDSGYRIVRAAEQRGIHDLDISVGNLMANKVNGIWEPILYDFNIMPQYLYPPNPIVGIAFKTGIRKKSFRDYRSLRNWYRRGKQKWWLGRN